MITDLEIGSRIKIADCRWDFLRGAITKKKTGKFGKNSQRGGKKKSDENSQFQFGNLKNLGGGGLNFSKMSEFQLFCNYFAILPL